METFSRENPKAPDVDQILCWLLNILVRLGMKKHPQALCLVDLFVTAMAA